MCYQILFIQGAGLVTTEQENVITDALKTALGSDFTIIYPPMPDADDPTYQAWDAVLTANLKTLSGKIILLGHSLGGSIILKHFSMEPVPDKIIGMILFGVPYWKDQHWDVSEYVIEEDMAGNLSQLDNIYFYYSTDDEVIPEHQFASYRKLMPQAHYRVLSGMDHAYHEAIPDMIADIRELTGNTKE